MLFFLTILPPAAAVPESVPKFTHVRSSFSNHFFSNQCETTTLNVSPVQRLNAQFTQRNCRDQGAPSFPVPSIELKIAFESATSAAKMMSVADFFYGHREPVWIVHTPQSSSKGYMMGTPSYAPATPQNTAATPSTPATVNSRAAHAHAAKAVQQATLELKVPVCCEGCEERVTRALLNCNGVESVRCDAIQHRVTVTGTAAPADVLKICKKFHKRSELLSAITSGSAVKTGKSGKNTPGSGKNVKKTPGSGRGWNWNNDWNSKNTPAAISSWQ